MAPNVALDIPSAQEERAWLLTFSQLSRLLEALAGGGIQGLGCGYPRLLSKFHLKSGGYTLLCPLFVRACLFFEHFKFYSKLSILRIKFFFSIKFKLVIYYLIRGENRVCTSGSDADIYWSCLCSAAAAVKAALELESFTVILMSEYNVILV